jgi:hypothetical protein
MEIEGSVILIHGSESPYTDVDRSTVLTRFWQVWRCDRNLFPGQEVFVVVSVHRQGYFCVLTVSR